MNGVPDDKRRRIAYLLLGTVTFSLAGTWVAGKIAVQEVAPFALATGRFALGSVLLAAWIALRGGSIAWPGMGNLPLILAMAATGVTGFSSLFLLGLERAPAGDGAILVPGLAPIVAATTASVAYSEPLTRKLGIALLAAIPGLILVVGPSLEHSDSRLLGDACFLGAALAWGVYTAMGRAATSRFGALNATLYAVVGGTLMLVPLAVLEGRWDTFRSASADAWWGFLYLTVIGAVLAYVLYYEGIARIGVGRASSFTLAVPVIGVVLTIALLGERPNPISLVGGAIVLIALWTIQRTGPPAPQDARDAAAPVAGLQPSSDRRPT